jgi:hypothetical protein
MQYKGESHKVLGGRGLMKKTQIKIIRNKVTRSY